MSSLEYELDYFDKYDIDYPLRIAFTGNSEASRKIIKVLLKAINSQNLTILASEGYCDDAEDDRIFTRYSPLVQNRINLQYGKKCIVFDNIVYHPRQILPLFREIQTSIDCIFLQSKCLLEDNVLFDVVFIVSYDEDNIKKIHSLYVKDKMPLFHFLGIIRNCIDQGDTFVLKLKDNEIYLLFYCEDL